MKLIVGLGNPGLKYRKSRHNVGFMFCDELIKSCKIKASLEKKFKAFIAKTIINGEEVIIIEPVTYMNLSGEAVKLVKDYYNIDYNDILVIYDDLDLPVGKIRIRPNGSSGGHKGMKSIIDNLQTSEIKRVRIGIGECAREDVIDYVLSKFNKDDYNLILDATYKSYDIVSSFISDSFDNFMSKYN